MSKGLEALNDLRTFSDCLATNKRFPKVFKESDCYDTIEKELKSLEIIKEKQVNVWAFSMCNAVGAYNASLPNDSTKPMTQEEFDLLKEVLL